MVIERIIYLLITCLFIFYSLLIFIISLVLVPNFLWYILYQTEVTVSFNKVLYNYVVLIVVHSCRRTIPLKFYRSFLSGLPNCIQFSIENNVLFGQRRDRQGCYFVARRAFANELALKFFFLNLNG